MAVRISLLCGCKISGSCNKRVTTPLWKNRHDHVGYTESKWQQTQTTNTFHVSKTNHWTVLLDDLKPTTNFIFCLLVLGKTPNDKLYNLQCPDKCIQWPPEWTPSSSLWRKGWWHSATNTGLALAIDHVAALRMLCMPHTGLPSWDVVSLCPDSPVSEDKVGKCKYLPPKTGWWKTKTTKVQQLTKFNYAHKKTPKCYQYISSIFTRSWKYNSPAVGSCGCRN